MGYSIKIEVATQSGKVYLLRPSYWDWSDACREIDGGDFWEMLADEGYAVSDDDDDDDGIAAIKLVKVVE